jgi:hypothetical protein
MSLINLSPAVLRQAANFKEQIEDLYNQLAKLAGSAVGMPAPAKTEKPVKKGGMSAAGRAKVAAAQKARWAKIKAAKVKPASVAKAVPTAKPAKKKFKMSAAAKAKISAAAKARWAKIKAAKK